MTAPRTEPDLAAALAQVLGGEVTGLHRLSAGASRETWSFALDGRALVLRRDPPGAADPVAMAREAECLRAAARAGVPVPALVAAGDGHDVTGTPHLVMAHVAGESLPPRLLRDDRYAAARAGLARELGRVLARIHGVDPAEVPTLEHVPDALATLRATHDAFGEARPALEVAFRWLAEHRPPTVPPRPRPRRLPPRQPAGRPGRADGGARLGARPRRGSRARTWAGPACGPGASGSRRRSGASGAGRTCSPGYAEEAGEAPDADAVAWWEVYGCVHWSVICRIQTQRHLGGAERSVELATLGRRAVEAEYDALLALGLVAEAT